MNVLIIGGGLSGILVSAALRQQGIAHNLVESGAPWTGSRASSGILNPVMGRKRQLVADYETLMATCTDAYRYLSQLLAEFFFQPVQITEVISGNKAVSFFKEKTRHYPDFLQMEATAQALPTFFNLTNEDCIGITDRAYVLQTALLQKRYLELLEKEGRLIKAIFHPQNEPVSESDFEFQGRIYTHIIYCNGQTFPEIPALEALPLSLNKGQALVLEIDAPLPRNRVFKFGKGLTLCPWGEKGWWAGASFEWTYATENPTADFLTEMTPRLEKVLKVPFRVVAQLAGFRVSTQDRRAVAGWTPQNRRVGFVTGLGTKGVLQAPRAAAEVVNQLVNLGINGNLFKPSRFGGV